MIKATLTIYTRSEITTGVAVSGVTVGTVRRVKERGVYHHVNAIDAWCNECSADMVPTGGAKTFATEQAAADAIGEHAVKCSAAISLMALAHACAEKAVA